MNITVKVEALKSYISKKGLRSSTQRDFIAEAFFRTTTHISLEELLNRVRKKNSAIGYATVYRTMKLLTDGGLAVARQFGDGQTRYENLPAEGHHDHIICIKCSRIEEFTNPEIEALQEKTAKRFGFKVLNHKLELYGYCSACI